MERRGDRGEKMFPRFVMRVSVVGFIREKGRWFCDDVRKGEREGEGAA